MLLNRLVLILALSVAGCLGQPSASGSAFEAVPRALSEPPVTRLGEVEVLGVLELKSARAEFGGLSGLAFDGQQVTAITDRGKWLRFRLDVDAEGRPLSIGGLEIGQLGGLKRRKSESDAEELCWTPEGWLVSLEGRHRLLLYPDGLSGKPRPLALPQGFVDQPGNGGVEAMARLKDGRLLLLSEEGKDADGSGTVWLGRPGAWQALRFAREGQYRPTGAAILPNGDLLVAERRFTLLGGFGFRLRRIAAKDIRPGALLEGREMFRLEPPLLVDNFESIAVHQRADGRLVAYIIADDNFSPFQATYLMGVLLPQ